jgi:hypothetical protein
VGKPAGGKKPAARDEQALRADSQQRKDASLASISNRLTEVKLQNEDIEKRLSDLQKRKEVCQGTES